MNRTWYLRVFVHRQELRWLDIINDSYVASHGCEVWEYSTTTQVKWCKGFRTEVFVVVKKKKVESRGEGAVVWGDGKPR